MLQPWQLRLGRSSIGPPTDRLRLSERFVVFAQLNFVVCQSAVPHSIKIATINPISTTVACALRSTIGAPARPERQTRAWRLPVFRQEHSMRLIVSLGARNERVATRAAACRIAP